MKAETLYFRSLMASHKWIRNFSNEKEAAGNLLMGFANINEAQRERCCG
jgi:hypothetical protein